MESGQAAGVGADAGDTPGIERILRFNPQISFVHPLLRSAVYHGAAASERRRAHEALATASDRGLDPDRRAWHLAAAASGADEEIADKLARSADRARSRGDWTGCAAFLERAARLTPDRARRAERTLATAEARLKVGDPGAAAALVEQAGPYPDDPLARARAKRLQGTARCVLGKPAEACPFLLDAAQALQLLHPQLAWDALLEAFEAALAAGRFRRGAQAPPRSCTPSARRRARRTSTQASRASLSMALPPWMSTKTRRASPGFVRRSRSQRRSRSSTASICASRSLLPWQPTSR